MGPARAGAARADCLGCPADHADTGGTRRLVADGRPVTPPGLQLDEVLAVDGETVLFTASDEPTQTHVWAHHPEAGLRRVSAEPGVHEGTARGGTVVLVSRTPGHPGSRTTILPHAVGASAEDRAARRRPGAAGSGGNRLGRGGTRPAAPGRDPHAGAPGAARRAVPALLARPGHGPLPVLMDPYWGPALRKVTAEQGGPHTSRSGSRSRASPSWSSTAAAPRAAARPGSARSTTATRPVLEDQVRGCSTPPAGTRPRTSTGSPSVAGPTAAASRHSRYCASPTSSTRPSPAPPSPTSACTTPTGASVTSATRTSTRSPTTGARPCWRRPS